MQIKKRTTREARRVDVIKKSAIAQNKVRNKKVINERKMMIVLQNTKVTSLN